MTSLFSVVFAQVARVPQPRPRGVSLNGMFFVLVGLMVGGIGWKLLQGMKAKRAVGRLDGASPDLDAIADASNHGRAAIVDLFRLLTEGKDEAVRHAAGKALARLWMADELIVEEEKALVTRGFSASWSARRTYPRDLARPIPVEVAFGVPFLDDIRTEGKPPLEWTARIEGADRASLESFGPWQADGRIAFAIDPRDHPTNGPHRRVLIARAQTVGLTSPWEHEPPRVPFTFEFDPHLTANALLAARDEARESAFASCASLVPSAESDPPTYLVLNRDFALRNPPTLRVAGPLPCDLAHSVALEIEGVESPIDAGGIVVLRDRSADVRIEPTGELPIEAITAPGDLRVRAVLIPDPERGWADPAVRSIWPGRLTTEWVTVRVVRR